MRSASPAKKPPLPPPSALLTALQAERLSELLLANFLAASLTLFWHAQADPTFVGRFAGWVAPGLSKSACRQAREELDPVKDEARADADSAAILEAATRWYLDLRLPATRAELWNGRPIGNRQRLSIRTTKEY